MSKELIISLTAQETKAAILDSDQVTEIHIERSKDHGIVGSICKGRVTKVLPGMQSAFVDIGLERDAFLYVSDFFEDTEEYDMLVTTAEEQVAKMEQGVRDAPSASSETATVAEAGTFAPNVLKYHDRAGRSRRSRRNRLRGKRYDEVASISSKSYPSPETERTVPASEIQPFPSILPGESLAKYQNVVAGQNTPTGDEPTRESDASDFLEKVVEAIDEAESSEDIRQTSDRFSNRTTLESVEVIREMVPTGSVTDVVSVFAGENGMPSADAEGEVGPELSASVAAKDGQAGALEKSPATVAAAAEEQTTGMESVRQSDSSSKVIEVLAETAPAATASSETASAPQTGTAEKVVVSRGATVVASKAELRNPPANARFFRRDPERRRRQYSFSEDRGEAKGGSDYPLIADLLKAGQEILVQVSKEPLGTKGARITSHIALPGRYLVYMPTVDHIGVSRKIESEEERYRLKRIIQENRGKLTGGFIVRTAGANKGEEEFRSDINFLSALWAEIKSKAEKKSAPAVIHRDLSLVQRLLRDQLSADFTAIRVDNENEFAGIVEFINRFQPSLVSRVKLYTKETPIFEEFGIQTELERALRSKVWLKSGGYIVIDQAEALVAIDVNTGKYVGKSNKLEDTIVKTNIEAARDMARQIRLRDLGGFIVCDFIDKEDRKNRQKVTQTLEEALRTDKSPSKVLQFNDFGLVAITRKRVKQSLLKVLCEPCVHCSGSGMVKSAQTICYEIQAEVKRMARSLENNEITIRVSPEVARSLKTSEISVINEIETYTKKDIVIKSDPLLDQEHFDIF